MRAAGRRWHDASPRDAASGSASARPGIQSAGSSTPEVEQRSEAHERRAGPRRCGRGDHDRTRAVPGSVSSLDATTRSGSLTGAHQRHRKLSAVASRFCGCTRMTPPRGLSMSAMRNVFARAALAKAGAQPRRRVGVVSGFECGGAGLTGLAQIRTPRPPRSRSCLRPCPTRSRGVRSCPARAGW